MPAFYRKDATVQNALGQALAGAHLWVLEQPAHILARPPRPRAMLFRDPDGKHGRLPNPLTSDGTGNFHYYAASNFYTECYFFQGQLMKVLRNQAVGCVCPTGEGVGPVPFTFGLDAHMAGNPNPGEKLVLYTAFTQSIFPPNFANPQSYGNCLEEPDAPVVFTVQVNDATVGTVQIDTNGLYTFSTPGFMMQPGDLLTVTAPDPADFSLAGVSMTFVATRLT